MKSGGSIAGSANLSFAGRNPSGLLGLSSPEGVRTLAARDTRVVGVNDALEAPTWFLLAARLGHLRSPPETFGQQCRGPRCD
jgi:hypothetical protein